MWANWIETDNMILSAEDAFAMGDKRVKRLTEEQKALVSRLRDMAKIDRHSNYEEVKAELEHLPLTWYPALLKAMVEACLAKNIFKKGRINVFVKAVEDKCDLNRKTGQELPIRARS